MASFVWTYTADDAVCLQLLQMLGYSTAVDTEACSHLGRSDFGIPENHVQDGIASFLSTFSVYFHHFLSTFF